MAECWFKHWDDGQGGRPALMVELLTPSANLRRENACSTEDSWRNSVDIILPQKTQGNPITQLRIYPRKPRLHYGWRILVAQSTNELKRESYTSFGIPINLAASDPPVDGTNILHSVNGGGQLTTNNRHQLFHHGWKRKSQGFPMGK